MYRPVGGVPRMFEIPAALKERLRRRQVVRTDERGVRDLGIRRPCPELNRVAAKRSDRHVVGPARDQQESWLAHTAFFLSLIHI